MLQELTDDGTMHWTCTCGKRNSAHVSHEQVEHPSEDEQETVIEGTHVDEQGKTWVRSLTRPTGKKTVHHDVIALPRCTCGARTHLKVAFTDQEWDGLARWDYSVFPPEETDASVQAAVRHKALAEHMKRIGKGPDDLKGAT